MNEDRQPTQLLYYPDFHPNTRWLKSMLLLVDEVKRIVPPNALTRDPDSLGRLIEELDGGLTNISPQEGDTEPDSTAFEQLERAMRTIRGSLGDEESRRIKFKSHIRSDGKWEAEYEGYTFLLDRKLSAHVRGLLNKYRLIHYDIQKMTSRFPETDGAAVVRLEAANVILSFIANRMARRHGLISVTDYPLGFAMNGVDSLDFNCALPKGMAAGGLAAVVAPTFIPAHVDEIPVSEYKLIRDSHEGVRAAFQEFLGAYTALHRLGEIEDVDVLQDALGKRAQALSNEYSKWRKTRIARRIVRWIPSTTSTVWSLGKAPLDPIFQGMGDVMVYPLTQLGPKGMARTKDQLFHVLAELDGDITALGTVEQMREALRQQGKL